MLPTLNATGTGTSPDGYSVFPLSDGVWHVDHGPQLFKGKLIEPGSVELAELAQVALKAIRRAMDDTSAMLALRKIDGILSLYEAAEEEMKREGDL